jgi:hypothetical protein
MEKKQDSINIKDKGEIFWLPFWCAGFMYSLGVGALDLSALLEFSVAQQIVGLLMYWFVWPFFLGTFYAG